jgi:large subunit ribosomal protein L4
MEFPVLNLAGAQVGKTDLPAAIFEAKVNVGLMHQYVLMQNANARLGTHKALRRSEVNRTKAKWYRQKGTGRARHGARSAPIFVGGGRAHGPIPHKYTKHMPRKMRHAALKSALTTLVKDNRIVIIDDLGNAEGKTKVMANALKAVAGDQKVLVVLKGRDELTERAIRNLERAHYLHASYLNVRDLLQYERTIITLGALEVIKGILAPVEA